MKFHLPTSEIFIPDGVAEEDALARTTHLCISAHQDDIEIMAAGPDPGMLPAEEPVVHRRGRHRRPRLPPGRPLQELQR